MGILNEEAKKELTKLEQEYKRQLNELMKGTPSAPFHMKSTKNAESYTGNIAKKSLRQ